jgi:hypothetical protein
MNSAQRLRLPMRIKGAANNQFKNKDLIGVVLLKSWNQPLRVDVEALVWVVHSGRVET